MISSMVSYIYISLNPMSNHTCLGQKVKFIIRVHPQCAIVWKYYHFFLLSISKLSGQNGCYLWTTDANPQNQKRADAITVDATSYALLTAVELGQTKWADKTACWLTTQENYLGGFKSSQVIYMLDWEMIES